MRSYILTESERAKVQAYLEGNRARDSSMRQLIARSRDNVRRLEQDLQLIRDLLNRRPSRMASGSLDYSRIQALRDEMRG